MHSRFKKLPIAVAVFGALYGNAVQAEEPVDTLEAVIVFGRGETRQVSEVGHKDIIEAVPGTSPLKVLSKLPGVNFNSADTFGAYEWGGRISVRGFNQNQLGFTLDDVPLGDMSYRNYNGLHISRAISTENIGKIILSQGTGALGTASTSNLGGTIQFYSLDPAEKQGATIEQSFGEDSARRTFARLDTGRFANGTRISLSATDQFSDKWKGRGEQKQQQFNSKLVHDFENARFSAFVNYSDRKEVDYMDLSKSSVRRLGYNWDYFAPNWNLAKQVATAVPVGNITSQDDAYYNGSGLRRDWLGGVTLDYSFNDTVSLKTTIYHHDQKGTGTWWTPFRASPGGTPISLRTLEFDINRSGILSALSIDYGIHKFNTGIWYENNDFDHAMRFYAQDNGPSSPYRRPSNPFDTRWNYNFETDTIQFHAQDTLKLTQNLTANIGFKSPHTRTRVSTHNDTAAGSQLNGSLTASDGFLPSAGLNFKLDERNEFFADAAQNIRAYRGVVKGGTSPFDTTQAGFDAIKHNIKPEESLTVEGGWRFHQADLDASATIYHVNFKNRLLALQQGSGIVGNPSVLSNVGKVETNGVELTLNWSPITHVKWSNSLSYNNSEYKDDFTSNGVTYRTSGKQVVDSPRVIFNTQLAYNDGNLFGHVGANHIDKRYYTYTNDQSVSGYTLWDLGVGYRWKNVGLASELNLQLGINNLFDKKYFAFGDNPYEATDPTGSAYSLLAGAPRTAFVKFGANF